MAFEGLRDQLKEKWADLYAKIQETSAYNTAREKFESQTPVVQKAIIGGAVLFVVLFLMSFPLSYLSEASDHMTQYEENRSLIQGLLRASRSAKESAPIPPPMDPGSLQARIESIFREKRLVPEQIGSIQTIPGAPAKDMAPALVVQTGVAVQLKQLNLSQIVDIATGLQNLGLGTKLVGMEIMQTAGQTHYYDLIFKVVNFGLPMAEQEMEPQPAMKGKKAPPQRQERPEGEFE